MPPLLTLHLVILAWAFTAVLGKLISMPALDMVVWRTALAALGFIVLSGILRSPLRLPRADAWKLLGIGALLGVHWVTFFLSGRLATASVSLAAMPTLMIWCSLIEPLVNGTRRWSRVELLVGVITVGAVWLIYAVEMRYWLGFSVGLFSALLAAIYAVTNKQVVTRFRFATLCTYQMAGACLVTVLLLPLTAGKFVPEWPDSRDFGWLLLFAFGCTVVPYAAFVRVMRQLPIFTINVVYNLETDLRDCPRRARLRSGGKNDAGLLRRGRDHRRVGDHDPVAANEGEAVKGGLYFGFSSFFSFASSFFSSFTGGRVSQMSAISSRA